MRPGASTRMSWWIAASALLHVVLVCTVPMRGLPEPRALHTMRIELAPAPEGDEEEQLVAPQLVRSVVIPLTPRPRVAPSRPAPAEADDTPAAKRAAPEPVRVAQSRPRAQPQHFAGVLSDAGPSPHGAPVARGAGSGLGDDGGRGLEGPSEGGNAADGSDGDGVGENGAGAIAPPAARSLPRPDYPERARRAGREGTVRLRVLVGTDGMVRRVETLQSSGVPELDAAAGRGARRWRFAPARRGDEPIEAWVSVPVEFSLETAR